jgi:putative DNA primase/helicase
MNKHPPEELFIKDSLPAGTIVLKAKDAPQFSEDRLALNFTERHAEDLRYVAPWSKWYRWSGTHWEHENTLAAFDMARKVCREAAAQRNKPGEAKAIARAKTVAAIEQLARSDRAFVAAIEQWNADMWVLNTPGGTIDLKTGNCGRIAARIFAPKLRQPHPAAIARCSSIS